MKLFSLLFGLVMIVSTIPACLGPLHVPQGYTPCRSDWDCKKAGEYCGFVGVDTYAVCRQ